MITAMLIVTSICKELLIKVVLPLTANTGKLLLWQDNSLSLNELSN